MKSSSPSRAPRSIARLVCAATFAAALTGAMPAATPPMAGDDAPRFTLKTLDDHPVEFAAVAQGRAAVLVVLRGWPGYQCPVCTRQVLEFVGRAADFAARNVPVVMVYPGPAEQLQAHAQEFLADKHWPRNFYFVLDPDYSLINRLGLRWDKPGETAYPSTFVIDGKGKISFAHVSSGHGDRVAAAAVLRQLDAPQ